MEDNRARRTYIEDFAGPDLQDLRMHADEFNRACEWRIDPNLSYHEMRRRRRLLSEMRHVQLMEHDCRECWLRREQYRVGIEVLTVAATVEEVRDPEARDYTYNGVVPPAPTKPVGLQSSLVNNNQARPVFTRRFARESQGTPPREPLRQLRMSTDTLVTGGRQSVRFSDVRL